MHDKCPCGSPRIARISAKCSDRFSVYTVGHEYHGYVPNDLGIGGNKDIEFSYCLACGCILGQWPLSETELERGELYWEMPCVLIGTRTRVVCLDEQFCAAHSDWLRLCSSHLHLPRSSDDRPCGR